MKYIIEPLGVPETVLSKTPINMTPNSLNKFITYKWDDCVTYQKLSMEEQLILIANDNIQL